MTWQINLSTPLNSHIAAQRSLDKNCMSLGLLYIGLYNKSDNFNAHCGNYYIINLPWELWFAKKVYPARVARPTVA